MLLTFVYCRCYSKIGKVGGRQKISIGKGCASHGIVVHEIGNWQNESLHRVNDLIENNSSSCTYAGFLQGYCSYHPVSFSCKEKVLHQCEF